MVIVVYQAAADGGGERGKREDNLALSALARNLTRRRYVSGSGGGEECRSYRVSVVAKSAAGDIRTKGFGVKSFCSGRRVGASLVTGRAVFRIPVYVIFQVMGRCFASGCGRSWRPGCWGVSQ